ncbi:MAG: chorismate-binding protein [Gammaproteobacteria bacterium]|nr:chorismate-binding protein [Gammaproteobacteria bacterium]
MNIRKSTSATDADAFAGFAKLASGGLQRIPVTRTLFADIDTPVGTYLKAGNAPYTYLLESVQGGQKWGRYSFIGLPSRRIIKVSGLRVTELLNQPDQFSQASQSGQSAQSPQSLEGQITEVSSFECEDPLEYIHEQSQKLHIPAALAAAQPQELIDLPRFSGGFVGYFSYECAAYSEKRLRHLLDKPDHIGCPETILMQSDEIIAFDNLLGKMTLICYADVEQAADIKSAYQAGQERLDEMAQVIARPLPAALNSSLRLQGNDSDDDLRKLLSEDAESQGAEYRAMVTKIKQYIRAGDVMQVVPSQRMEIDYTHDPFDFYRALRTVNPAPYMFHLNLGDFSIAGASPEILSRLERTEDGRIANLRPIAGTRRRGKNKEEDDLLAQEMLADPKEIAEHLMLIDLGRNDVGKVSKVGSVKVNDEFSVEKYSHVMHISSNVIGELKDDLDAMDLLRASLPAGTLSGAAKIRAMEIIAELETSKRGIYGGALGYLDWQGNMDMCIAIRTAVIKDNKLFLQAGGGIVADSDEHLEWRETLNKRGALLRVVSMLGIGGGK